MTTWPWGPCEVLREAGRNDVVVAGVDGLSEALKIMKSEGPYVATALNDPRYLGDVTIQTARQVAAEKARAPFYRRRHHTGDFRECCPF